MFCYFPDTLVENHPDDVSSLKTALKVCINYVDIFDEELNVVDFCCRFIHCRVPTIVLSKSIILNYAKIFDLLISSLEIGSMEKSKLLVF